MKLFPALKRRSASTRERDDLISSSLTASSVLSKSLLEWSESHSRERPLSMRFHNEWLHDDCPVMRWYKQQRVSCTAFQSIEHRRDEHGPFYHEYLLLKLTDSAVCRVERTGEGSRADAIRYIGCKSHDLIRWFPADKAEVATAASTLIAEVDLGRVFDIIDVLAICYTIQNVKPCSVYTLQRYNCYFLCLTILAVLTRRAASWETVMSADTWDSCILTTLDELLNLPDEEAKTSAVLRLCAALDPASPHSSAYVMETLQPHLTSNPRCLIMYNESMSDILWRTSWDLELSSGLQVMLHAAAGAILESDTECGHQLRSIVGLGRHDEIAEEFTKSKRLRKHLTNAILEVYSSCVDRVVREYGVIRRMREIEYPAPLHMQALITLGGPVAAFFFTTCSGMWYLALKKMDPLKSAEFQARRKLRFEQLGSCFPLLAMNYFDSKGKVRTEHDEWLDEFCKSSIGPIYTLAVLNTLAADALSDRSDLHLLMCYGLNNFGLEKILGSFIAPGLVANLSLAVEKQEAGLVVWFPSKDQGVTELSQHVFTGAEFQTSYIKDRIRMHAERVAKHRLAAAPIVCMDIEKTMENVWKSLPPGFGGILETRELEAGRSDSISTFHHL